MTDIAMRTEGNAADERASRRRRLTYQQTDALAAMVRGPLLRDRSGLAHDGRGGSFAQGLISSLDHRRLCVFDPSQRPYGAILITEFGRAMLARHVADSF